MTAAATPNRLDENGWRHVIRVAASLTLGGLLIALGRVIQNADASLADLGDN